MGCFADHFNIDTNLSYLGKLFSEILLHLTQIGGNMYYVDWKVLDSIDYGVPAARKRVYIVAVRKDHLVQSWNWPAK